MHLKTHKSLLFWLLLTPCISLLAQQDISKQVIDRFDQYRVNNLQEKVYLHTDRSNYVAGDLCWFKIYLTDASFHKPLSLSRIVYVEVLDTDKQPVLQTKVAVTDGRGSGSLALPFTLTTGSYLLRAYTSWMQNYSADYFFQKEITIINTLKLPPISEAVDNRLSIGFFPEGGNLVAGIENTIAFKITNAFGQGIDGSGTISDENGNKVASFSSSHAGMGKFVMTPAIGQHYQALVSVNGYNDSVVTLPAAATSGYAMQCNKTAGNLTLTVASPNPQNEGMLYLFIHTRMIKKAMLTATLSGGKAAFNIDSNILDDGISQFTIFNHQGQPLAERLYFKRPQDNLTIKITSPSKPVAKRSKIDMPVATDLANGLSIATDLSLAVAVLDSLNTKPKETIASYFWLSSDLKGKIEDPLYYLQDSSAGAAEAADNLMLTQGWRRFTWSNLDDEDHNVAHLPDLDGQVIKGNIVGRNTKTVAKDIPSYLSATGSNYRFAAASSKSDGALAFDVKTYFGKNELAVQPGKESGDNYSITLQDPFSDKPASWQLRPIALQPTISHDLQQAGISSQVQQVYHNDSINRYNDPALTDSAKFYGNSAITYFLDDYTRFQTMEEVLREYVKEVRVRKNRDKFEMSLRSPSDAILDNPLMLVDGLPVLDANSVIAIDPLKVKRIDVVPAKYFIGDMIANGIVSFSTYNGDLGGYTLNPATTIINYPALQWQREFYSPEYNTASEIESRLPDFRRLLYWEPNAGTDADGKRKFSFFTGDLPGTYLIMVEGMTAEGNMGATFATFTVE